MFNFYFTVMALVSVSRSLTPTASVSIRIYTDVSKNIFKTFFFVSLKQLNFLASSLTERGKISQLFCKADLKVPLLNTQYIRGKCDSDQWPVMSQLTNKMNLHVKIKSIHIQTTVRVCVIIDGHMPTRDQTFLSKNLFAFPPLQAKLFILDADAQSASASSI